MTHSKVAIQSLLFAHAALAHRPDDHSFQSRFASLGQEGALVQTSERASMESSLHFLMTTYGTAKEKGQLPSGLDIQSEGSSLPEEMLEQGKPFTYMRWGDGEWMQAEGKHEYIDVLKSYPSAKGKNYFPILGSFFLANNQGLSGSVEKLLKANNLPPIPFYDRFYIDPLRIIHAVWSKAHVDEGKEPWVLEQNKTGPVVTCDDLKTEAPQKKSAVILVGPSHLNDLTTLFRHQQWIDSNNADAPGRVQEIAEAMISASKASEKPVYFLVAAGWAKLLFTHIVYPQIGSKDTIIDIGSSCDPYANVMSRDYSQEARKRICKENPCFTKSGTCASGAE